MAHAADYEIGRGDVLKIVVVGQAEMTGSFTVDGEGMVNLPILGKVKAAEHTLPELERKLTTLLADGIPQAAAGDGDDRRVRQPEGVRHRRGAEAGAVRAQDRPHACWCCSATSGR